MPAPLLVLVLLPFVGSAIAALLPSNARNREAWLAGVVALGGALIVGSLYPQIADGGVMRYEVAWLPQWGLDFVLRLDGFAWLFAMLVLGIGLLVVVYARYYMSPADPVPRFFSFLLAFMGSMLGIVLSGNLIQLVLFWELTSLTSFLLIGYWHHRADARRGARMALTVTAAGGLCLLVGVLLLGHMVGSYDLDIVLAAGEQVRAHAWYVPTLVLIALGALTKSAQFPFHFWLPRAMAAPTPVSAYLHSATMVKAGVFLLARLWPVLAGTDAWSWIIGGAGLATLLLGGFMAIFQNDLKGLLAYSTISHLGLITVLLGIGTPLAAVAAIFHIINHAAFKASLFMAAGIIDHETGTRDFRRLAGLVHAMPITTTLAIVASAAMAGVPLLNGFLSKEMFFSEAVTFSEAHTLFLPIAATVAGIFTVTYSLRFIHDAFFGPLPTDLPKPPHEPPRWMRFPIELLVLACLVIGILPALTVGPFLQAAAFSVLRADMPAYSLAIWHGISPALIMSFLALTGGGLLYYHLHRDLLRGAFDRTPLLSRFDGKAAFDRTLILITAGAGRLEALSSTRRLQPQLFMLFAVVLAAAFLPLSARGLTWGPRPLMEIDLVFVMLWLIGMACAVGAAWQAKYHRLMSVVLLGGAGLVTVATFAWLSAPDLALTQLAVETVTLVLLLLGLRWLPRRIEPRELGLLRAQPRARLRRARDLLIAVAAGTGLSAFAYAVLTRPAPDGLSSFFIARALPEGGGANIVNVILVDFRGFDTLGEITVLGIVALTVYALLRRFRPAAESIALPTQQQGAHPSGEAPERPGQDAETGYLVLPAIFVRALLPVMGVVAIYLLMRGHNAPGGGFVAGLVMAVAMLLQYIVGGTVWVETHTNLRPHRLIGVGLSIAALTGIGAWLFGYPFLTSHSPHPVLPLLGELPLPSAFFFDIGVFLLVIGATALMLIALAHQSVRSHRMPHHDEARAPIAPVRALRAPRKEPV